MNRAQLRRGQHGLQIGAREIRAPLGDRAQIHVGRQPHLARHRTQYVQALVLVRKVAEQQLVQSTGSHQRRVNHVGPRGRREHIDARAPLDAVQVAQQLIDDAVGDARRVAAALGRNRLESGKM